MPAFTDRCYDCGAEYVTLTVEDGHCPDCESPATPLVGDATVLDVRPIAHFETELYPDGDAIEVVVRDDTDRMITYSFVVPGDASPYAAAITFEDATIRRGDPHWSEIEGPDAVAAAVEEHVGAPPGTPETAVEH